MAEKHCCCGGSVTLFFPCSGSADVGELADLAARKLARDGCGRMFCLAGIGSHQKGFLEAAKAADELVALDGCPAACASRVLEHAGFLPKKYNLKEMGFLKGHSPVNEETIEKICAVVEHQKED